MHWMQNEFQKKQSNSINMKYEHNHSGWQLAGIRFCLLGETKNNGIIKWLATVKLFEFMIYLNLIFDIRFYNFK